MCVYLSLSLSILGIVLRAFVALSNLVDTPQPQIQRSIRDAGVVNRFVSFLKSQTPMLYTEGCKGIRRMSVRPESREEIHMAGGVAALVAGCTREDAEGRVNCFLFVVFEARAIQRGPGMLPQAS